MSVRILRHPKGAWRRDPDPSRQKESVEVVGESDLMPPGCLPLEVCWARPTGGRPGVDPEHDVVIIYVTWPGNTSGSPRRNWKMLQVRGTSGRWKRKKNQRVDVYIQCYTLKLSECNFEV